MIRDMSWSAFMTWQTAGEKWEYECREILLPPVKYRLCFLQDDVCYYHYMDGDGFATKLIVDEEGKIRQ